MTQLVNVMYKTKCLYKKTSLIRHHSIVTYLSYFNKSHKKDESNCVNEGAKLYYATRQYRTK